MKLTADLRDQFEAALRATGRSGIDNVIAGLDKLGFFKAPASSKHHCAYSGGLLHHSMNVYEQAIAIREIQVMIRPEIANRIPKESVAIAALLHDVCKAEIYKSVMKNRKNADGRWESYPSWEPDYTHCPLGHGEKSVIRLLRMGLEMTEDEILAIRWHMAGWDVSDSFEARGNLSAACEKSPLLSILISADELATRISEVG